MPPFVRVDHSRAGATAVGILIPPGQRTIVIVRPRALNWDLLPVHIHNGVRSFCQFGRDEAAGLARLFQRELESAATSGGDPLVVLSAPPAPGFQVGVKAGELHWVICARSPGRSYEPLVFDNQRDAEAAALRLSEFLCPAQDAGQEYYFNTQHFDRSNDR